MYKNKSQSHSNSFKKPRQDRVVDLAKQDSFLFNKTPILASALQRLKKNEGSVPKKISKNEGILPNKNEEIKDDLDITNKPVKKVKKSNEESLPSFAYTPLQKDLYNFYTINKISLKGM